MSKFNFTDARATARILDQNDPLKNVARQFHLPKDIIYLDGNSLGCMPKAARAEMDKTINTEWSHDLVTSWNKAGWFELPTLYGDVLAPLIGADTGEVVISDTTSANIFKAVFAGLSLRPDRHVIVAETSSFPTDLYMINGVSAARPGVEIRLADEDGIRDLINHETAVLLLNHVDYRSGKICNITEISRKAQDAGAIVIWDLCHSAGNMPVDLNKNNVDLAVGCTYKYLNGGPGAPAFNFAAKRHLPDIKQPLSGWWGHANPFAFEPGFTPDQGIRKFLCGTQPILSMRAMKAGLDVFSTLSIHDIRAKSITLTSQFIDLVTEYCPELTLISPRDASLRGSQVSLGFDGGFQVIQALIERGVIGDFRMPNIMRFGFSPLYNSHADVLAAAEILADILQSEIWREARFQARDAVT